MKVRVRVKVKNGSRVEREDVLTQSRRGAEHAEMFSRVEHVERVEVLDRINRIEKVEVLRLDML